MKWKWNTDKKQNAEQEWRTPRFSVRLIKQFDDKNIEIYIYSEDVHKVTSET